MFRAPHIISRWEWFPVFDWRGKPTFHKHLQRSLPSEIGMREGLCVFCLKCNGPWDALTQKKAGFPCSGLNAGSYFISWMFNLVKFLLSSKVIMQLLKVVIKDHLKYKCIHFIYIQVCACNIQYNSYNIYVCTIGFLKWVLIQCYNHYFIPIPKKGNDKDT